MTTRRRPVFFKRAGIYEGTIWRPDEKEDTFFTLPIVHAASPAKCQVTNRIAPPLA